MMTELDYLKCKFEDKEKAFDELHKRHIILLKQQGELERENEQLKKDRLQWITNQEELECLTEENKQLKEENEYLKEEMRLLKVDLDNIDLFEERKVKYSEFWVEKLKKIIGD